MDVALTTGGWASQVIAVADDLCKRFGIAIDWSQENILPVLKTLAGKLISFEIYTSIFWLIIGAVLLTIGIVCVIKGIKNPDDDDLFFAYLLIAVFTGVSGLVVVGSQVYDIIQCTTFPEMYIYEFITHHLKN